MSKRMGRRAAKTANEKLSLMAVHDAIADDTNESDSRNGKRKRSTESEVLHKATSEFENETRSGLSRRSSRTRTADEKPQSDEAAEVSSPEPIGSTKEGRGGNAVSVASNEKNKPEADERTEEMKSPAAKKLRGNIDVSLAGSSSRKTIQSENSSGSANKKGRDKLMRTPKGSDDDKDDDYDPRKNEKGSKKKKRIKRLISTKGEVSSSTSEDVDNSDADEPATGKGGRGRGRGRGRGSSGRGRGRPSANATSEENGKQHSHVSIKYRHLLRKGETSEETEETCSETEDEYWDIMLGDSSDDEEEEDEEDDFDAGSRKRGRGRGNKGGTTSGKDKNGGGKKPRGGSKGKDGKSPVKKTGRKDIRKIMKASDVDAETLDAIEQEKQRLARLAARRANTGVLAAVTPGVTTTPTTAAAATASSAGSARVSHKPWVRRSGRAAAHDGGKNYTEDMSEDDDEDMSSEGEVASAPKSDGKGRGRGRPRGSGSSAKDAASAVGAASDSMSDEEDETGSSSDNLEYDSDASSGDSRLEWDESSSGFETEATDYNDFDSDEWEFQGDMYNPSFMEMSQTGEAFTSTEDDMQMEQHTRRGRKIAKRMEKKQRRRGPQLPRQVISQTEGELIRIPKHVVKMIEPHQVEGIKFMWETVVETVADYEATKSGGFGCILAHAMGLGKTMQVILFTHLFLRHTSATRVLIVVPVSTLDGWYREFVRWLPVKLRPHVQRVVGAPRQRNPVVGAWHKNGGVVLLGFETLRSMLQSPKNPLQQKMAEHLMSTDLVVIDEAHRIKNSATGVSKALHQIKTKRRICLTGTPLQNNLEEYWCMVDFVRPKLLGTLFEFRNRFVNPISNGQHRDSLEEDIKVMRYRSHILHKRLHGFVHRRTHAVISKHLPPKLEFVIPCALTPLQGDMYRRIVGRVEQSPAGLFKCFHLLNKIWTHPDVLRTHWLITMGKLLGGNPKQLPTSYPQPQIDAFVCQLGGSPGTFLPVPPLSRPSVEGSGGGSSPSAAAGTADVGGSADMTANTPLLNVAAVRDASRGSGAYTHAASASFFDDSDCTAGDLKPADLLDTQEVVDATYTPLDASHGNKFLMLFRILDACFARKEKVCVFSQSIQTLDCLEDFFTHAKFRSTKWKRDRQFFRLDGSTPTKSRQSMIARFNRKGGSARVFFISTKAGGLGLNITGASRVVLLDSSWNPSHDVQAVARVYRYGQEKPVFIYRLVAAGTMERKIYDRQVLKMSLANRVVDEMQQKRHSEQDDLKALYQYTPSPVLPDLATLQTSDAYKSDVVLQQVFTETSGLVDEIPLMHDCFLEENAEEGMTSKDKEAAEVEFTAELRNAELLKQQQRDAAVAAKKALAEQRANDKQQQLAMQQRQREMQQAHAEQQAMAVQSQSSQPVMSQELAQQMAQRQREYQQHQVMLREEAAMEHEARLAFQRQSALAAQAQAQAQATAHYRDEMQRQAQAGNHAATSTPPAGAAQTLSSTTEATAMAAKPAMTLAPKRPSTTSTGATIAAGLVPGVRKTQQPPQSADGSGMLLTVSGKKDESDGMDALESNVDSDDSDDDDAHDSDDSFAASNEMPPSPTPLQLLQGEITKGIEVVLSSSEDEL